MVVTTLSAAQCLARRNEDSVLRAPLYSPVSLLSFMHLQATGTETSDGPEEKQETRVRLKDGAPTPLLPIGSIPLAGSIAMDEHTNTKA